MTGRVRGIIIRKIDYREYDRLFTVYTREQGKIPLVGVGTKKITSKLGGSLEVGTSATFTIAKSRTFDRIASADECVHTVARLPSLDHTAAALYCFEIIDQMVHEGEPDAALFLLITEFLGKINTISDHKPVDLAQDFIAQFLSRLGYYQEGEPDIQKVLQLHLDRPLRSRPFFNFLLGMS